MENIFNVNMYMCAEIKLSKQNHMSIYVCGAAVCVNRLKVYLHNGEG